jgi:hypothetical protein
VHKPAGVLRAPERFQDGLNPLEPELDGFELVAEIVEKSNRIRIICAQTGSPAAMVLKAARAKGRGFRLFLCPARLRISKE